MQSEKIKKNKCGSGRHVDGVTLREPGVRSNVRTARAVRTEMSKEEFAVANVRDASTLTLLRIRVRNIRSVYECLWRCYVDGVKVPFLYDSKERDGDDTARINELRDYIVQDVRVFEDLRAKFERSTRSKSSWKKYNKGDVSRRKMFLEREAAIAQELTRREQEEADGARAPTASTGSELSTSVVLYPKQYAVEVTRIQKELDAEDHSLTETSGREIGRGTCKRLRTRKYGSGCIS